MLRRTINIELINNIPVIQVALNNKNYYAILDTGCNHTVFDKDWCEKNKNNLIIQNSNTEQITLTAAGNNITIDSAVVFARLTPTNTAEESAKLYILGSMMTLTQIKNSLPSNIEICGVIGTDVLDLFKSIIDFKSLKLIYDDLFSK